MDEFFHSENQWSELHEDMEGEDDLGQAWAWTRPKQFSALGKNQKDDRRPAKKGPQKKALHQKEDGVYHLDAVSLEDPSR